MQKVSVTGWAMFPPSSYIHVVTPRTSGVRLFGERVFKEVIGLNEVLRVGPKAIGLLS